MLLCSNFLYTEEKLGGYLTSNLAHNLNYFTILFSGWQSYFPVPFSQYNKEISPDVKEEIEVKAATGHFDIYRFI